MNIPTEEEEKKKKERPNTYVVYNHSNSVEVVLIFSETSWQGIEWHDTQTEQEQNKNKQRIAKAWTVSVIIILW